MLTASSCNVKFNMLKQCKRNNDELASSLLYTYYTEYTNMLLSVSDELR